MNVDQIVEAGIDLADREGLGGLSIRKLATHLGTGTMSAYRHVESRDQLVQLMVAAALGEPPASIRAGVDWRERTTRWVEAIVARYVAHQWIIEAPVNTGFSTRNRADWLETLLVALDESGLTPAQALDAALLIDGHARATAALAGMMATASPPQAPAYDPAEFPSLARVFGSGLLTDGGAADASFGLERILDGIEVFAARERRA